MSSVLAVFHFLLFFPLSINVAGTCRFRGMGAHGRSSGFASHQCRPYLGAGC